MECYPFPDKLPLTLKKTSKNKQKKPQKVVVSQFWRLEIYDQRRQHRFLLRAGREDLLQASPLASGAVLAISGFLWLIDASLQSLPHLTWHFALCVCVQIFPFYSCWNRAHANDFVLTNYIYNDPISE